MYGMRYDPYHKAYGVDKMIDEKDVPYERVNGHIVKKTSRDDDHIPVDRPKSFDAPGQGWDKDSGETHNQVNKVFQHGSIVLNPKAPIGSRIKSAVEAGKAAGQLMNKAREAVAPYRTPQKTPQKQISKPEQPGPPQKQGERSNPTNKRPREEDDSAEDNAAEEISMEVDPEPKSAAGGTIVGGGLRQGSSSSTRNAKINTTFTIPKKHTWVIKMDQNNYKPTTVGEVTGNHTIRLDSRWYEVPDNEIAFYLDHVEIDYLRRTGRYFKIKDAHWKIRKTDVVTINTRSDTGTQAVLQTQWQPSLGVSQPLECLPFSRVRNWADELGGSLVVDNKFECVHGKSGNAHNGVPTYLPKITWVMQQREGYTGSTASDPLNTMNPGGTRAVEHIDVLFNCMTEYEMMHTEPIGARKQCMPGWRTFHKGPYSAFLGPGTTAALTSQQKIARAMVEDYYRFSKQRDWHPRVMTMPKTDWSAPYTQNATYKPLFTELIGPDPWDVAGQFVNNMDEFQPHMEMTNPPTFICLNRLPKIANQNFEIVLLIEIDSSITIEVDVPMIFPFNGGSYGVSDSSWHGDNRKFMTQNDVVGYVSNDQQLGYTRTFDFCVRPDGNHS